MSNAKNSDNANKRPVFKWQIKFNTIPPNAIPNVGATHDTTLRTFDNIVIFLK